MCVCLCGCVVCLCVVYLIAGRGGKVLNWLLGILCTVYLKKAHFGQNVVYPVLTLDLLYYKIRLSDIVGTGGSQNIDNY